MSVRYVINILSEVHLPINLLFEQRNKTRISACIPVRASHGPFTPCQNSLILHLFPCRFSSNVMEKHHGEEYHEMLCTYVGSLGTGHPLL